MTTNVFEAERVQTLLAMLTRRRPAGSKTERAFIRDYIRPLGVESDRMGNLYKRIGKAPVLWSCHTDTVHKAGGKQHIAVKDGHITLSPESKSNCLGADDTVGVWLMCEMIRAQRPGLYIFHRAEEIGGIGSSYIAEDTPEMLDGIACAIALDRRGTNSVITHQGGRTCSDAFAQSLSAKLGLGYSPDSGGIFTDTANYVDLVGECTNLSVGYSGEHTRKECLDYMHALNLREALLAFDHTGLTYSRKAGDIDPEDMGYAYGSRGWDWGAADQRPDSQRALVELVKDHPWEVADILEGFGLDWESVCTEIYVRGGIVRK